MSLLGDRRAMMLVNIIVVLLKLKLLFFNANRTCGIRKLSSIQYGKRIYCSKYTSVIDVWNYTENGKI